MKKYKLGEIADYVGSGMTPLRSNELYWKSNDIPWLKTEQLGEYKIFDTKEYISNLALKECNLKVYPKNTLSIAMYGEGKTRGNVSILAKEMTTNQACCNLIVNKTIADYKFVFYYLKNSYNVLRSLSSGIRKNLNSEDIKNFEISLPPLESQQKIAAVLSTLDDKIALNRRMNAKLEQIAKRLYDHWFVQFDFPNADGKPYKASGGKMEYNEVLKREIPEGWEVKKLGDVCEIVLGGTPSTANNEFWDNGTISWLNSGEVGIFPIVESEKKITEIAVEKSTTEFLKAGSVTLSITRYLRPSILAIDACINQSVVGIKENDLFKNCFLYSYLQNEIDRLMSLRTGAQQPHINKEIVEDSFINIPPKELMEKYEKKVTPIYLQIINIAKETQKLTMLRDRLLPLLMNGQVEVR